MIIMHSAGNGMTSRTGFFDFLIAGAAALLASSLLAAALERVPNTTLSLPADLPPANFALSNAFASNVQFYQPVKLASPPGETNRLFVVEKSGKIFVITNMAAATKTLFLDLTGIMSDEREGGVLGLAFHPNYQSNRYFYVFYTLNTSSEAGSGFHDRLSRFETSPQNPHVAVLDSEEPLITQYDDHGNHN